MIDTAGLRVSDDAIEKIGIERAWSQIEKADAVLFLHDLTRIGDVDYLAGDAGIATALSARLPRSIPVIDVWNKQDLVPAVQTAQVAGHETLSLSAKTGAGLEGLRRQLLQVAGWQSAPEGVYMARERHVQALKRVELHLTAAALHLAARNPALDLLAEELRLTQNALSEITGEFSSDDLLGVIFSSFCIGK